MSDALASAFARIALTNIRQEYPNKLDHVMNDATEVRSPRSLHPAFFGSYDWHSSVHMHWLLACLLRSYPKLDESAAIAAAFDCHFSPPNMQVEIAYLNQPSRQSFERTYGWAWLLKLQAELIILAEVAPIAVRWRDHLQPLADIFVERYLQFMPIAQFPIRAGTHANSAFGLLFALEYAQRSRHAALEQLIHDKAKSWFGEDRRYPAEYEPGGDDFLSGGLMEAALMFRVLDTSHFEKWWASFCPDENGLRSWLIPVEVGDRRDPKLVHLDGLNLSRTWCWKIIVGRLPPVLQNRVRMAIDAHLSVALPHTCTGDYGGMHWLASFALLALGEE